MNEFLKTNVPAGYDWLLARGLVGYEPFSQLQPWRYLPPEHSFWASNRWPGVTNKRLLAFAKRQDCDDLACFVVDDGGVVQGVALIHGWTENGFDFCEEFANFWTWLKRSSRRYRR